MLNLYTFELHTDISKDNEGSYLAVPAEVVDLLLNNNTSADSRLSDDGKTVYLSEADQEALSDRMRRQSFTYDVSVKEHPSLAFLRQLSPPVWI